MHWASLCKENMWSMIDRILAIYIVRACIPLCGICAEVPESKLSPIDVSNLLQYYNWKYSYYLYNLILLPQQGQKRGGGGSICSECALYINHPIQLPVTITYNTIQVRPVRPRPDQYSSYLMWVSINNFKSVL